MPWSDIDFDELKVGAVTVDPDSEQNFYQVLNTFGVAIDERINVIATGISLPTLPNIRFELTGEIRTGTTFIAKYRNLIRQYHDMWFNYDWYNPAALTDPVNFANYELTDVDLETAMGTNAYELLINYTTKNMFELWSADLLNGLYELYKLTSVNLKGLVKLNNLPTLWYNGPVFWGNDTLTYIYQGTGSASDDPPGQKSYGTAKSEYLGNITFNNTSSVGGAEPPFLTIVSNEASGSVSAWSIGSTSRDSMSITIKSEDLLGNILTLDIAGVGALLSENYEQEQYRDTSGNWSTSINVYNNNYPIVDEGSNTPQNPPVTIEFDHDAVTIDPVLGTQYEYYVYGPYSSPVQAPYKDPANAGTLQSPERVLWEQEFTLRMHPSFLIDVNNSALEFYISP